MSGSLSEYATAALLGHVAGKTAFAMPSGYLALCTVVPTATSTGATITEATYTGYVRTALSADMGVPTLGNPSTIFNATQLVGPNCTGGTSTVVGIAVLDSITIGAGNMLWWASTASTVISTTQTPPTFPVNSIELTIA